MIVNNVFVGRIYCAWDSEICGQLKSPLKNLFLDFLLDGFVFTTLSWANICLTFLKFFIRIMNLFYGFTACGNNSQKAINLWSTLTHKKKSVNLYISTNSIKPYSENLPLLVIASFSDFSVTTDSPLWPINHRFTTEGLYWATDAFLKHCLHC